jgi:hypothetical protein
LGAVAFRELWWPPLAAAAGCLLVLAVLVAPEAPSPGTSQGGGGLEASIATAPLSFEPNAGRTDGRVDFLAHSVAGGSLYLTSREAVLALPQGKHDSRALRLGFRGADPDAPARGLEERPGKANSFIGDDPSRWRTGIPTYGRVRYEGIYPGIDLDFYGSQQDLEYDFRLAPHADPSRIAVEMGGPDSLRLARNGDLLIEVGKTTVRQQAPVAYQRIGGERRPVPAAYELHGSRVGFRLGAYDRSRPLVIDPVVLGYSTYLGGGGSDLGHGIAVDSAGAAYLVGTTDSGFPNLPPFPTQDHLFPDQALGDAFVTKFDPDSGGAVTLAYSTYLGASDNDSGFGIAVDSAGAAYVTGITASMNFPTEAEFQTDQGGLDVFVTKLNPDSGGAVTLAYSTYLGGSDSDSGNGTAIAVDSTGAAYVSGHTDSTNFPTQDAFQTDQGDRDVFVTMLNPDSGGAVTLAYSTYLGGGDHELARENSIAVDSTGAAYVSGNTDSTNFPTQDAFQTDQGGTDAFVTKVNPDSGAAVTLAYSTYLGGLGNDFGFGITVDSAQAAHATGFTLSTDFPTQDAFQTDQGGTDAFVTRLDPDSGGPVTLAYSTYLGASGSDSGIGIAVDPAGAAYLTGSTDSPDFPTQDAFQGDQAGSDAFATKLNPDSGGAVTLAYSTYLGGSSDSIFGPADFGTDIAVDSAGVAYVTGHTFSTDFPAQDAFQADQGDRDAFAARLVLEPPPPETPPSPAKANRTITFDATKAKGKKAAPAPLLAVRKGGRANLSGDVSAPGDTAGCESNQAVELQRRKPKGATFATFEQLQTDAAGNFSTKEKIKKTFEYRAILAETAGCDDAASGSEKVKAKKKK